MRDEGIGGTVANAGLGGDAGWGARVLGPPLHMVWIIQPTRIEGRRDHGHQEFYLAQGIGSGGHRVRRRRGPGGPRPARPLPPQTPTKPLPPPETDTLSYLILPPASC